MARPRFLFLIILFPRALRLIFALLFIGGLVALSEVHAEPSVAGMDVPGMTCYPSNGDPYTVASINEYTIVITSASGVARSYDVADKFRTAKGFVLLSVNKHGRTIVAHFNTERGMLATNENLHGTSKLKFDYCSGAK